MERAVVNNRLQFIGYCPVPKHQRIGFTGDSEAVVLLSIKEHLKNNLEDPEHSEIAEMEEWL